MAWRIEIDLICGKLFFCRFHKSLALESGRSIDEAVPDVVKVFLAIIAALVICLTQHTSTNTNRTSSILWHSAEIYKHEPISRDQLATAFKGIFLLCRASLNCILASSNIIGA